jgi:S-formylglutathione hydrolase
MKFSVIDPSAGSGSPMPVIFWLSGLTCSDRNFIEKAGAFEAAVKHSVLIGLLQPSRRSAAHALAASSALVAARISVAWLLPTILASCL